MGPDGKIVGRGGVRLRDTGLTWCIGERSIAFVH
jgi:hypothetical protein